MAAPPLVFLYIGRVFEAIFYGTYCLIFGSYWQIQLKRPDRWKGKLLYPLTVTFILCTAYFIIDVFEVQFYITITVLNEVDATWASSTLNWLSVANNSLYTAIDLISQLILLYRCWIMWHQPLVMIIPCILSLAFLATALTTLGIMIKYIVAGQEFYPDWYESAVTAFIVLSLGVNTLVTALIIYKITTVFNDIRGFNTRISGYGHRDLYPLISILIESGLMTFVGQLAQSIMYKSFQTAYPLVSGSVVMLFGISLTVVLVRVELGVSFDRNTSKTAFSTNSGRPIPLAAFPSKLNQTSSTDVEAQVSDDSYDAGLESKHNRPNRF